MCTIQTMRNGQMLNFPDNRALRRLAGVPHIEYSAIGSSRKPNDSDVLVIALEPKRLAAHANKKNKPLTPNSIYNK